MNELSIIKRNGSYYVDSREVAAAIGKDHRHLLRDIRGYIKVIEDSNAPNFGRVDFFVENAYIDAKGEERPCYLLSKMGCEMVANKLTGEKGVLFTAAYVYKFNMMEAAEQRAAVAAQSMPRLNEFNSAVRNVLRGMSYSRTSPQKVMDFLRGVYEPLGIEVGNGRPDAEHFSATEIAKIVGICSDTGRPHGHAAAAIISKFDEWPDHTIAVPYGLVGFGLRYDWHMIDNVREWIKANNHPRTVPYLNFVYHINYARQISLFDIEVTIDLNDARAVSVNRGGTRYNTRRASPNHNS